MAARLMSGAAMVLLQNADAKFAQATSQSPYLPILPANAKRPLDLNKETMAK